jgi:hypothetical protein
LLKSLFGWRFLALRHQKAKTKETGAENFSYERSHKLLAKR